MGVIERESDLAPIAGDWLRNQGYDIRSEVHNIDIVGRNQDGLFHAVELKKSFNIDVLSQGLRGQRWAGEATIVVPQPPGRGLVVSRKIEDWVRICRGLSLGLCIVKAAAGGGLEIVWKVVGVRVSPGRKDMLKFFEKEFSGRSEDRNTAGMPGTRLHTAYSEKAMRIARWLIDHALTAGSLTPCHCSDVAKGTGYSDARSLMYNGYKGYFARHGNGQYGLNPAILKDVSLIATITGDFDIPGLIGLFPPDPA